MTNPWDKLKILSGAVAAVLVPVILLIVGQSYTAAIKEREVEAKFVELAISILKDRPNAGDASIREWATKVIDKYSGVELGDTAKQYLITSQFFVDNFKLLSQQMDGLARRIEKDLGHRPASCSPGTPLPKELNIPKEVNQRLRGRIEKRYKIYRRACQSLLSSMPED